MHLGTCSISYISASQTNDHMQICMHWLSAISWCIVEQQWICSSHGPSALQGWASCKDEYLRCQHSVPSASRVPDQVPLSVHGHKPDSKPSAAVILPLGKLRHRPLGAIVASADELASAAGRGAAAGTGAQSLQKLARAPDAPGRLAWHEMDAASWRWFLPRMLWTL